MKLGLLGRACSCELRPPQPRDGRRERGSPRRLPGGRARAWAPGEGTWPSLAIVGREKNPAREKEKQKNVAFGDCCSEREAAPREAGQGYLPLLPRCVGGPPSTVPRAWGEAPRGPTPA